MLKGMSTQVVVILLGGLDTELFGSSEESRNRRNHQVMRQRGKFRIDGVLKSSLYNEVLIRLNMEEIAPTLIIDLDLILNSQENQITVFHPVHLSSMFLTK
ncbi:MAG: hypothetical protein R2932_06655 [Caldilineaceae bacterium]